MNRKDMLLVDLAATAITREMVDRGKIIEAGWIAGVQTMYKDVPTHQLELMREAYLAGAQHLFFSIMGVLEAGTEPTKKDYERMDKIGKEMLDVTKWLKERYQHRENAPKMPQ